MSLIRLWVSNTLFPSVAWLALSPVYLVEHFRLLPINIMETPLNAIAPSHEAILYGHETIFSVLY